MQETEKLCDNFDFNKICVWLNKVLGENIFDYKLCRNDVYDSFP